MTFHPKWLILAVVVGLYLPIAIDATVLHIAVPTLSNELQANMSELLWIIDIYPLLMAGLILVMGALGDRIGYRKLMLIGSIIFGIASAFAAFAPNAEILILARALLALGASMILPGTLACLRYTFVDEKERNFALGMWVMAGSAGAAFGPLVGGLLLEYFFWGSVFLINLPIILVVIVSILYLIPKQQPIAKNPLNLMDAAILISSILFVIYSLKSGLRDFEIYHLLLGFIGVVLGIVFTKRQINSSYPLFDIKLFASDSVKFGFTISVVAMIALVGFELLISQKLQYVYQYSPLQAGLYIFPFMISVSVGALVSSPLLNKFGPKKVAVVSLLLSAISMYFLSNISLNSTYLNVVFWMVLLGLSILCAFLAATSAILSGAPIEQAASAGAIEGMSYELGTGLGVTIFGLLASYFYMKNIDFKQYLTSEQFDIAKSSIGETYQIMSEIKPENVEQVIASANSAFLMSHESVLVVSAWILFILSIIIGFFWKEKK